MTDVLNEWRENGRLHRIDGPAKISWDDYGFLIEEWFYHGFRHRIGDPAYIITHRGSGLVTSQWWYNYGKQHRDDGPAVIQRDEKAYRYTAWYRHGLMHRENGPAMVSAELERREESWDFRGVHHREEWRCHGVLHRLQGPAWTLTNKVGTETAHFVFGEKIAVQDSREIKNDREAAIFLAKRGVRITDISAIIRRIGKTAAKSIHAAAELVR